MKAELVHLADKIINRPMMLLPDKLALAVSILDGRIGIDGSGLMDGRPTPAASRSSGNAKESPHYRRAGDGVAIIPVIGSLVNRGGWLDALSGVTSYTGLRTAINTAIQDEDISTVILDIDSPGGEAVGAFEAADHIRDQGTKKPIVAWVDGLCCSAAYCIASSTSRIVVTPSSVIGSIGVVSLHVDRSRRMDREGLTPTMIYAGAHKVDGNPLEPLSEEVKSDLQAEVDFFYEMFVARVAQGRPLLSANAIRATEARTFIGERAVAAGLVDAVGTLSQVINELSALDRKSRSGPLGKYELAARLHGDSQALRLRVQDAHAAGRRAGMAAAMIEAKG